MAVHRVRLIHWKAEEAREKVRKLREIGYRVAFELPDSETFKKIKKSPPDVVVIDLSGTPSHGRDAALFLRQTKATRHVPLVFVDGAPEKVERIRKLLPDAEYTPWRRIRSSLKRAIAHPPKDPVVPKSTMEGYAGTPLPEKLGIKADSGVALIGAPEDFEKTLGKLPRGVKVRRAARGKPDLAIWFTKSRKDLERRIRLMGGLFGKGGLWIAWPKKTSKTRSDLTQEVVRKIGLASGLVDYKVCSIDETWSGLKFARRKPK